MQIGDRHEMTYIDAGSVVVQYIHVESTSSMGYFIPNATKRVGNVRPAEKNQLTRLDGPLRMNSIIYT